MKPSEFVSKANAFADALRARGGDWVPVVRAYEHSDGKRVVVRSEGVERAFRADWSTPEAIVVSVAHGALRIRLRQAELEVYHGDK